MSLLTDAFPQLGRTRKYFPVGVDSPKTLTKTQIQQFNEKGYISPLDVFSVAEATSHRTYFDQLMIEAAAQGYNSYAINGWHKYCEGIYDLVTNHRILDYVQDLLGENLICWGTHYFSKMPGDGKRVSWHQDASYWPLTPSKTVTVWLAIDDADIANGAMQVIPRSHLYGQIAFEKSTEDENNVLNQSVRAAETYGDNPVSFEMKAGQMSLHTDWLLHGSEPNTSDRRRCGLTMRFVPPEVQALQGWNKNSVICRGSDPSGHWANNLRPVGDQIPIR